MRHIEKIFEDKELILCIKKKLPYLFALAEKEASRGGKVGMEIGSVRERVVIALLMYYFGRKNVDTNIQITESEVDVRFFGEPVSIKTKTGKGSNGIKAVWTVDWGKTNEFFDTYQPKYDILLIQINWSSDGNFFLFPIESQKEIFRKLGKEKYLKLPTKNTNPRGVEFSALAIESLISHEKTRSFPIKWERPNVDMDVYQKWIDYWDEN